MRLFLLISLIFLMGCDPVKTEYVFVEPEFDNETLTPCAISNRRATTLRELGLLATEHLESALCANSKIETVAEVLKKGPQ